MKTISAEELRETLTAPVAIQLAAIAADLEGRPERFDRPERKFHPVGADGARFGVMPLILKHPPLLGLKAINIFPQNAARGAPTHVGLYQLFSGTTGEPLAMMDANVLTGIRTAAMSAEATRRIAPGLTDHIAIVGTGDQAGWHARTFGALFSPKTLTIAGRNEDAAARLADEIKRAMPGIDVAARPIEHAVGEAGVICTVTASQTPVIRKEWLGARVHINAVGAHSPDCAELDEAILEAVACYTDDPAGFPTHCGEYLRLAAQGRRPAEPVRGLWDHSPERRRGAAVTVYKSFGTAVQDIVFAARAAGIDLSDA